VTAPAVTAAEPPAGTAPVDVGVIGDRIERLLEASAATGPVARERADELVRLVVELYGAGLERVLEIAYDGGALTDPVVDALAADPLVSSLLLVHGLHPYAVTERVQRALDGVRPYLGSHGGDVRLLDVSDTGVVELQLLGTCDGCASSAVTLELAVSDAIRAAAPEVTRIDVVAEQKTPGLIPVEQLTARLRAEPAGGVQWSVAAEAAALGVGELVRTTVGGVDIVLCRLTSGTYAYRDECVACGATFEGARLARAPAAPASAVLTCHSCGAHYDVRRAGVGVDDPSVHLEPLPLLERDGTVEVAVRTAVPA
jgi:Fe-S cluster biogenesis protein NfuA/nitrite reductase/ring-hydroxylating ferredoxin subunit